MDILFDKSYRGKIYINNKALKAFLIHLLATNYADYEFHHIQFSLLRKYFLHLSFTFSAINLHENIAQFLTQLEHVIRDKLYKHFQLKLQNMNVLLV